MTKSSRVITNTLILLLLMMTVALASCSDQKDLDRLSSLDRQAHEAMSRNESSLTDSLGSVLLKEARACGNQRFEAKAHFFLSNYITTTSANDRNRRMAHLDSAERIARQLGNDTLLCSVYNQRGVWESAGLRNIATAQYWFTRSIALAQQLGIRKYSIPAELNMSEACRLSGDTIGFSYDRKLLEYARDKRDSVLLSVAAMHCADYLSSRVSDTLALKPYIDILRSSSFNPIDVIPMVYARFFVEKGRYEEAERELEKLPVNEYTDIEILKARTLHGLARYQDSEQVIDTLLAQASQNINNPDMDHLMRLRAENARGMNNLPLAYRRQQEYIVYRDSADAAAEVALTKRYKTEYEVAAKDREISEQKMRVQKLVFIITAIIVFIMTAVGICILWYRRRRRFYQDIVHQNRDFIERQKILSDRLGRRAC